MYLGFRHMNINTLSIVWWIVLPIEAIIVVTISSVWRMLSFKETHLNERLSLLTLIIIGEGIIGVTKTVGKLWPGDQGPNGGAVVTILAIVILMVRIFLEPGAQYSLS
jgi:low temperature requirement protein LtrA